MYAIRSYYVLNKRKIKDHFALEIPYWRDSLQTMLTTLKELQ